MGPKKRGKAQKKKKESDSESDTDPVPPPPKKPKPRNKRVKKAVLPNEDGEQTIVVPPYGEEKKVVVEWLAKQKARYNELNRLDREAYQRVRNLNKIGRGTLTARGIRSLFHIGGRLRRYMCYTFLTYFTSTYCCYIQVTFVFFNICFAKKHEVLLITM